MPMMGIRVTISKMRHERKSRPEIAIVVVRYGLVVFQSGGVAEIKGVECPGRW